MARTAGSNEELIELELTSLIQKLAFLRGGMTPRTFPKAEYEVIRSFGLSCCRLMSEEVHRRMNGSGTYAFDPDGDYQQNPFDADDKTEPGFKRRKNE